MQFQFPISARDRWETEIIDIIVVRKKHIFIWLD